MHTKANGKVRFGPAEWIALLTPAIAIIGFLIAADRQVDANARNVSANTQAIRALTLTVESLAKKDLQRTESLVRMDERLANVVLRFEERLEVIHERTKRMESKLDNLMP